MAKKRLHKGRAKVLLAVLGIAAVGSFGAFRMLRPKDSPARFDALTQSAVEQNNWLEAWEAYRRSVALQPTAEKFVKLGQIARHAAAYKPELIEEEWRAYEQAIATDPTYLPGLRALFALHSELQLQPIGGRPAAIQRLRELAKQIVALDPTDKVAAAMVPKSTVIAWNRRMEVDPQQLEADLKALAAIVEADPSDGDSMFVLASAHLRTGSDEGKLGHAAESAAAYQAANALAEKSANAARKLLGGDNGAATTRGAATQGSEAPEEAIAKALQLYVRSMQVYAQLANQDAATGRGLRPKDNPYLVRSAGLADEAIVHARPTRPMFREVSFAAATAALLREDTAGAEKIYKSLIDQLPADRLARQQYAMFLRGLRPPRLEDAIALLAKPLESGVVSGRADAQSSFNRIILTSFRIDAAELEQNREKRAAYIQDASADIQTMLAESPDNPTILILAGRWHLLQGKGVEAVQYLGRARSTYERTKTASTQELWQLSRLLANSYLLTGQTGLARMQFVEAATLSPTDLDARLKLVELLAAEGNAADSTKYLAEANKIDETAPVKNAELAKLNARVAAMRDARAALASRPTDGKAGGNGAATAPISPEEALAKFRNLPEATKQDRLMKANFAMNVNQVEETVRLLRLILADDPKDAQIALNLSTVLSRQGRKDEARQVIRDSLAANPADLTLRMTDMRLSGAPDAEVERVYVEGLTALPDELERNVQLFNFYAPRDQAKAKDYLARAAAIKPDDKRVLSVQFDLALAEGKFEDAERLARELERLNADQFGGRSYRYRLLVRRGQNESALDVAREITVKFPDFAESWNTLGEAQIVMKDIEGALASFQQSLKRQAGNPAVLKRCIDLLYQLNRGQEAGALIDEGLRSGKGDADFVERKVAYEISFAADRGARALADYELMLGPALSKRPDLKAKLGLAYAQGAASALSARDVQAAQQRAARAVTIFSDVLGALPTPEALATMSKEERALVPEPTSLMAQLSQSALMSADPAGAEAALRRAADALPPTAVQPPLVLAEYYASLNRPAEAEANAREAVRRGGAAAGPRRVAAGLFARMGKVDDAIAMLDGIDPADQKQATSQRIDLLLRAGRLDQAEKVTRAALAANPKDNTLFFSLVEILIEGKRYEEAERELASVFARDRTNVDALFYSALIQLNLPTGDPYRAVRSLEEARDLGGLPLQRRRVLISAYDRVGNADGAAREMADIVKANPENRDFRLQLLDRLLRTSPPNLIQATTVLDEGLKLPALANDPDLLITKARVALARQDLPTAVASARAAVAASKNSPNYLAPYLSILIGAKQYQQVVTETDSLQKSGLNAYWLHLNRGIAKSQLRDRDGALADFTTALNMAAEADPSGGAASQVATAMAGNLGADEAIRSLAPRLDQGASNRVYTALLLQGQGKTAEAISVLEPALAKISTYRPQEQLTLVRNAAGLLLTPGPQQNYQRAAELYKQLLQLTREFREQQLLRAGPDDLGALNNLAFILSEKVTPPKLAEALQYSERAYRALLEAGQVDPIIFDTHGWILVLNGKTTEGISILSQAVARRSFVEGHYHLGHAYRTFGMFKEAAQQAELAERALAQSGADPSYKPKIEELTKAVQAELGKASK